RATPTSSDTTPTSTHTSGLLPLPSGHASQATPSPASCPQAPPLASPSRTPFSRLGRHFAVRRRAERCSLFLRQPRLRRAGLGSGPGSESWKAKKVLMFCVAPPELETKMNITKGGLVLFSANSNSSCMELSKKIAERLGVEMGKVQVYQEPNRETRVQIQEDVNTTIMELLIMVYACKTSCAKSIIGVIPYFPYSKQCKMRKRGSIKEIQGFFNIPVDNLRASPFLLQYIQEEIPDYRNAVIVAKSPASAKRAQSFAERLRLGIAVIHGEAQDAESDLVDGRHSPPMVRSVAAIHPSLEIPMLIPKEKPPITVVGDVGGRIAIIVDDIIDDVDSFLAAAETLKERGAYKIFVMATHGLLSSDAPRLIEESAIDEKLQCPKIKTVDISMILSEAIRRIHNGESMSYLFRNIGLDD
ncbi:hypothetical protein U0070_026630, partial [Myodes glareolus]